MSVQINLITITKTQKEALLTADNEEDFMEEVASELVLNEWIRFGQAEMGEERHNQTHGNDECGECLRIRPET